MKFIKKLCLTLVLLGIPYVGNAMEEARAKAKEQWNEEKSKFKDGDRTEFAKELQQQIQLDEIRKKSTSDKEEQSKFDEDIEINKDKLDFIESLNSESEIRSEMDKIPAGRDKKVYEDAIARQQKIQNDIDSKIIKATAEQIQSKFNPADGGKSKISNTLTQITDLINGKIILPIKNAIDKFVRQATNRGELSPKQSKAAADKTLKRIQKEFIENKTPGEGTQPPPTITLPIKSLQDQLNLWGYAENNADNLNFQQRYEKFNSDYISKLENDDIIYTIQNNDPKAVQEFHNEIVNRLNALGVDDAQISKLASDKENAVKKIKAEFNTPEAKQQTIDFFNPQNNVGEFNSTAYEKLVNETNKLKVKSEVDLQNLRDNVAQLRSTVDLLHNYATYALENLPLKNQNSLLEFLQDQQILLSNLYDNISLSPYLKPEDLNTVFSDARTTRENLQAAQRELTDEAIKARIKNEKRREVQQLENQKGINPLNDAALNSANIEIPNAGSAFIDLLVKEKPLSSNTKAKFASITREIESFVKNAAEADPSNKSVKASEILLSEIKDLQDGMWIYNNVTDLSSAEQNQLVLYYDDLDALYAKVGAQAIKDMNNLLKTLSDGTRIYLEQAKRASPSQETIKALEWQQKSPVLIESWFKQGRLDMTTSEDVSGV